MNQRFVTLFSLSVLLSFVLLFLFSCSASPPDFYDIPADVFFGNYTGITIDTDALHFGTIAQEEGGSRIRELVISNDAAVLKKIMLSVNGTIAPGITFSETTFFLAPSQNITIFVTFSPSSSMDYGNYTGTVHAVIQEASLFEQLLLQLGIIR